MTAAACKIIICQVQELRALPPGWCLETIIREKLLTQPEIQNGLGNLSQDYPSVFDTIIDCIESPQMDKRQQEFMRYVLNNIYRPPEDWIGKLVGGDTQESATTSSADDDDDEAGEIIINQ